MMKPRWLPIELFILNWWSGRINRESAGKEFNVQWAVHIEKSHVEKTDEPVKRHHQIIDLNQLSKLLLKWYSTRLLCKMFSTISPTWYQRRILASRLSVQTSQHRSKSYLCQCRLCCLFHRMTIDFIDLPRTQSIAPQSAKGVVEESLLSQPVGFFCFLVSYFFYSFYFHISCYYLSFFVCSIFSCLSLSFS